MPSNDSIPLSYTVGQAAKRTNISETKLWSAIKDGRLRSFKLGRSRRVSESALREFISDLENVTKRNKRSERSVKRHQLKRRPRR